MSNWLGLFGIGLILVFVVGMGGPLWGVGAAGAALVWMAYVTNRNQQVRNSAAVHPTAQPQRLDDRRKGRGAA